MSENPYQTPEAAMPPPEMPGTGWHEPTACPAGQGSTWFFEGWNLFRKAPGMLIVMLLLIFVCMLVVGWIPFLGGLVIVLFSPHFRAGFYQALQHAFNDEEVAISDLFAPLQKPMPLLVVGALYLAATIVLGLVIGVFFVGGMGLGGMHAMMSGQAGMAGGGFNPAAMGLSMLLGMLIAMALWIPVMMAFLFAPILVFLHGVEPVDALKLSFRACLRNMVPFLIWGLVWLVALIVVGLIVAFIPFIGWLFGIAFFLVAMPLYAASIYQAWLDIFVR